MSKIEWLNSPHGPGETWNPVTGCTPIAEGCANCWAARMAKRLAGRFGYPHGDPFKSGTEHWDRIDQPGKWKKPRTIAVDLMGDGFHAEVGERITTAILDVVAANPRHRFIFLTKRPSRMSAMVRHYRRRTGADLTNAAFGVSLSTQDDVDKQLGPLSKADWLPNRFVSIEPLLGPIDIRPHLDWLTWVIIGGESGQGARPCKIGWIDDLRQQAKRTNVPVFVKQWGSAPVAAHGTWCFLKNNKGGNPMEWPPEMRIRQWPTWLERKGD